MTTTGDALKKVDSKTLLNMCRSISSAYGHDDPHATELREALVSRHRYLSAKAAADAPQAWSNAKVDTSRYHVSASLIFDVDRRLCDFWDAAGHLVQHVSKPPPGAGGTNPEYEIIQYLVGFQVSLDVLMGHIGASRAARFIDNMLKAELT